MSYHIHTLDVKNSLQNYIWLLEDCDTKQVIVVDPTEAKIVMDYCNTHQLTIQQIWLTHWHKDHIGGVPELLQHHAVPVYGPKLEIAKIPFMTHPLTHDDHFNFNDVEVEMIAVPGHTLGHIVYYIPDLQILFSGDTLFAMGCGRVFEGTFEQMYHSLNRLAALPPETKVYCTHEYTLSNAKFARHVDPDNLAIQERFEQVEALRQQELCTLPSSIALELETNPFLRANSIQEFQQLRELKDQF